MLSGCLHELIYPAFPWSIVIYHGSASVGEVIVQSLISDRNELLATYVYQQAQRSKERAENVNNEKRFSRLRLWMGATGANVIGGEWFDLVDGLLWEEQWWKDVCAKTAGLLFPIKF